MPDVLFTESLRDSELNEVLLSLEKDIDIRFNSVLKLLHRVFVDFVLLTKFLDKYTEFDGEIRAYRDKRLRYRQAKETHGRKLSLFTRAQTQRNTENAQRARQRLQPLRPLQPPEAPTPPTVPRLLRTKYLMYDLNSLFSLALFEDYITLMDNAGKRTGSDAWFKCLNEQVVQKIAISLMKWRTQSVVQPKSPNMLILKANLDIDRVKFTNVHLVLYIFSILISKQVMNVWTYSGPGGTVMFQRVTASHVEAAVRRLNAKINSVLRVGLDEYYPEEERSWMRAERLLIEPTLIHGLYGKRLEQHGRAALNLLLSFYGVNKIVDGEQFDAVISADDCRQEYEMWKQFAVHLTSNVVGLESEYERITGLYRLTCIQYKSETPNWFKMYDRILLDKACSMGLERTFHARALYQTPTASRYKIENLSDRLVLHHNSAEPGSAASVILYVKAFSEWHALKKTRFYSAAPPLQDPEMRK